MSAGPFDNPPFSQVTDARDAMETAFEALRPHLRATDQAEQDHVIQQIMDPVVLWYGSAYWHLAYQLAALLPGVGPAILHIAEQIDWRIQMTPVAGQQTTES